MGVLQRVIAESRQTDASSTLEPVSSYPDAWKEPIGSKMAMTKARRSSAAGAYLMTVSESPSIVRVTPLLPPPSRRLRLDMDRRRKSHSLGDRTSFQSATSKKSGIW